MNQEQRSILRIADLICGQVRAQEATRIGHSVADQRRLNSAIERYSTLCRQAGKARNYISKARHGFLLMQREA